MCLNKKELQNKNESSTEPLRSLRHMIDYKCSKYEHNAEKLDFPRNLAEYDAFIVIDDIASSTQQIKCDDAEIGPV